jgi:hypothetical protein
VSGGTGLIPTVYVPNMWRGNHKKKDGRFRAAVLFLALLSGISGARALVLAEGHTGSDISQVSFG